VDNGGIGWGLLGCCIPLVGLILFLVWKNDKPNTAKAAGIGALVGVCLSILSTIISMIAGAGAGMAGY
jgi:thiol:disulfide interchange protein